MLYHAHSSSSKAELSSSFIHVPSPACSINLHLVKRCSFSCLSSRPYSVHSPVCHGEHKQGTKGLSPQWKVTKKADSVGPWLLLLSGKVVTDPRLGGVMDGGGVWFWETRVKSCGEMGFAINSCTSLGHCGLSASLAVLINAAIKHVA